MEQKRVIDLRPFRNLKRLKADEQTFQCGSSNVDLRDAIQVATQLTAGNLPLKQKREVGYKLSTENNLLNKFPILVALEPWLALLMWCRSHRIKLTAGHST